MAGVLEDSACWVHGSRGEVPLPVVLHYHGRQEVLHVDGTPPG